ncbi:hypothetical protein GCM10010232_23300 [Streptomyces amakusaensis]|uniref:DUF4184 family protein n=1 Tax=Streptomyces amakusaensis TaxID=67271 RepID=A0ABW0AG12_9ACTN
MPFTLCHPAAVLPLLRPPFVPAALVAGSLAPDVPYFLSGAVPVTAQSWYAPFVNATETHEIAGALLLDLPLTAALLAVYWLVRRPVAALLPRRAAVAPVRGRDPLAWARRAGWLLLSALIGVATHLVWDSFTHWDGEAVVRIALLRAEVADGLTVARLAQHLSTAVGAALIALWLWRRRSALTAPPADGGAGGGGLPRWARRSIPAALAAATLAGALVRWSRHTAENPHGLPLENTLAVLATGGGAAFAAALVCYAALWWLTGRGRVARR